MRALVIDDSRAVRIIIRNILHEMGMEVVEAGNGREALEQLQQNPDVELVLVDWNMPEMNGLDFIRAVRSQRCLRRRAHRHGDDGNRERAGLPGAERRRQRVRHEAVQQGVLVAKLSLLDIFGE